MIDVDAVLRAMGAFADAPDLGGRVGALAAERALVDRIAGLERVKAASAATQAVLTARLFDLQRARAETSLANVEGAAPQVDETELLRSLGGQVGLARRESPHAGRGHVGLARALTLLPAIRHCLLRGETSEYRVTLVARELGCLSAADRGKADEMIAAKLPRQGNEQARRWAAGVVQQLDAEAALAKIKAARRGRCVTIRSLPDAMVRLSAILPMATGVAAFASLYTHAQAVVTGGQHVDGGRGQVMADEFAARLLGSTISGQADTAAPSDVATESENGETKNREPGSDSASTPESDGAKNRAPGSDSASTPESDAPGSDSASTPEADAAANVSGGGHVDADVGHPDGDDGWPPGGTDEYGVPLDRGSVDIQLIMTDRALFDGDDEPALVPGFGPIPAAVARRIVTADRTTRVFLRRLFARPSDHQLVAMDSRARLFPAGARRLLLARDQICRTPWCDAPIRQLDHVMASRQGGRTELLNAQGLCAACNLTKEAAGWRQETSASGVVTITTPTGHRQDSRPPDPPHSEPWAG